MRNLIQRDEQPDRVDQPYTSARIIGTARIHANPRQPREFFEPTAMEDLARSIGDHGVLQPIVVRPVGGEFEIVAGERRWRGAQAAGLNAVPCIVRPMDEPTADLFALIENIHREDLDPAELYRGLRRLRDDGESLRAIARRIGKPIDWISNKLGPLTNALTSPHVMAGQISLTAAEEVDRAPEEYQPTLLQAALQGKGKEPLRQMRQAYERGELPPPARPAVGLANVQPSVPVAASANAHPLNDNRLSFALRNLEDFVPLIRATIAHATPGQREQLARIAHDLLALADSDARPAD